MKWLRKQTVEYEVD